MASETYERDADGNYLTIFYRVTAWGKLGELCAQKLHKGDFVPVAGDFAVRPYKDRDGQDRSQYSIKASNIDFSGRRRDAAPPSDSEDDALPI